MARQSYNLDGVKFAEEGSYGSAGSTFNVDLGWVTSVEVNTTDEMQQLRHIKGGTDGLLAESNLDLLHRVNGTLKSQPLDWIQLQYLLGDYTATTTYTINPSRDFTSLTMKGTYDETDAIQIVGLMFSKGTISLSEGEPVDISYDFIAKKDSSTTETVEGTTPSENPMTFLNGSFSVDGNNYKINTATITVDLQATGKRNIENVSAGDERVITEIVKGNLDLSFDINADLEDIDNELDVYRGGTTVQEARSDFTIVLTMESADGDTHTLTLTGARGSSFRKNFEISGEIKNFQFNGKALDIQATGTV